MHKVYWPPTWWAWHQSPRVTRVQVVNTRSSLLNNVTVTVKLCPSENRAICVWNIIQILLDGTIMQEGREGARTKGLQKPYPWYRGRPHTLYKQWATWRMWVCACALGSSLTYGVVCRMDIIKKKQLVWDLIKFVDTFAHQIEKHNWTPSCANTQILNHR